jgi:hypothetical protein
MNELMKRFLFVALVSIVLAGTASATTTEMKLVSGASSIVISDNSSMDLNSAIGTILYTNPNFNGWSVSVSSGVSHSPGVFPVGLDLTSVVSASVTPRPTSIQVFFSDTGFTALNGLVTTYSVNMGGGSTQESAWLDSGNNIFSEATLIGSIGPFTSTNNGTQNLHALGGTSYSLTLEQDFTSNPGDDSFFSADGKIAPTPEPSTIVLFGAGILGLLGLCFQQKRLALS